MTATGMWRSAPIRRVLFQHVPIGWSCDMAYAACLGLKDEVRNWWPYHFDVAFTFPCGLAQEEVPHMPDKGACSLFASNQADRYGS